MRNAPRQPRLLDRLWGLVGFGRGYSEEDVAQASIVSHPAPWHHENGRVVRDGPDVAALASEVRDLIQTATDLSRDLADLSQDMSALKRARRPFPSPAAAPSPVPGSDLDLFPSEAPES